MAEIEILFPTVQYGNVRLTATPEELGLDGPAEAYALGVQTAVLLNLFQQGFKVGSTLDVSAPQGASQEAPRTISQVMSDEDVDSLSEAQAILDRELGGVTEVSDPHAEGGSQYYDPTEGIDLADRSDGAPWESKVDAKPKPWETGSEAPKASPKVSADW